MERRLGRGLGALLTKPNPQNVASPPAPDATQGSPSPSAPTEIRLDRIRPNPFQPRKVFDAEGLEELRTSIENHGLLQPIVVRRSTPDADGDLYELVSGERRCRASELAGRRTIPAIVRTGVRDDEMLELALVENVQRKDLDPIERAHAFQQMADGLDLTQEQVAAKVGLKRSTVANHIRLLELPDPVRDAVSEGLLSMGHARAILSIEAQEARIKMMEAVVRDDLSVRAVERLVRAKTSTETTEVEITPVAPGASGGRDRTDAAPQEPWLIELENRLRESLGTKVRLQNGPDFRGQIVIEYYDQASLDSLITRLAPRKTL